jgi:putative chitinase
MTLPLTIDQLCSILPHNKDAASWYEPLQKFLPKYKIDTVLRLSAFLAQCAHESEEFTVTQENLNYSADGLNKTFGKYFIKVGRDATPYARQPEKIANVVYADRMGNGNIASGDGWKYRGRGLIQTTGHDNYSAFAKSIGMTIEQVIAYIQTKDGAVESACWFWTKNNLNALADASNITKMTEVINGGDNGLKDRIEHYNHILGILNGKVVEASPAPTSLKVGSTGPEVVRLQKALGLTADGSFGPATKDAVTKFQSQNGLTADGIAGPSTLSKLFK